jgi:cytochrome c553
VRRPVTTAVLGITCFLLGAAVARYYDVRRPPKSPGVAISHTGDTTARPGGRTSIDFASEPLWAYGFDRPPLPGEKAQPQPNPTHALRANEDSAEQTRPRHIRGSHSAYSLVAIRDLQNVIDWFPGDHPPMTDVIAHGPARMGAARRGCGSCHLPNGKGRPENASVAGLPVAYFLRQLRDFRDGKRHSADPRKPNTYTMIALAKNLTNDEAQQAANYFASMSWAPWIRVVETDLVPRTRIDGNLFLPIEQEKTQPIAGRIIEVPEDVKQAELNRNPRSGFVAYVPVGSLKKGEDLVLRGGVNAADDTSSLHKTTPCITCHSEELTGVADIPPLAGRSPSYLVRQMWDMQQGTRNGDAAQWMKPVLANLSPSDMVAIAAYLGSRPPGGGTRKSAFQQR